jgi:hypothetical protein
MNLISLLPGGLKGAFAAKLARWVGTLVGGAVGGLVLSNTHLMSFLTQACASLSSEDAMKAGFGALFVAGLTLASSLKDAAKVDGKMAVTASNAYDAGRAQGQMEGAEVQVSADTHKVAAVAEAMKAADAATKQDRATIVGALKTGSF